jgi:hypothetical protein
VYRERRKRRTGSGEIEGGRGDLLSIATSGWALEEILDEWRPWEARETAPKGGRKGSSFIVRHLRALFSVWSRLSLESARAVWMACWNWISYGTLPRDQGKAVLSRIQGGEYIWYERHEALP